MDLEILSKEELLAMHKLLLRIVDNRKDEVITQEMRTLKNKPLNIEGLNFLHCSAMCGVAEMTQWLIEDGWDINVRDNKFGFTPLMLAIKEKNIEIVKILLKNNADIYIINFEGNSCVDLAFYSCIESPSLFLKKVPIIILETLFEIINNDFCQGKLAHFLLNRNNFEMLAIVVFGNIELSKYMLENGFPIDFHEPHGRRTALHYALCYAKFENAKLLISRGANMDALDADKYSPLYFYTYNFDNVDYNSEVLKSFLRYSTTLSVPDRWNNTNLSLLLSQGQEKTVRIVLLSGAHVNNISSGKSILNLLFSNTNVDAGNLLEAFDIKFDVNERNSNGRTVLMEAVNKGCLKKVEFLLRHGADINLVCSSREYSALSYATISCGHVLDSYNTASIVELLLQYGANSKSVFRGKRHLLECDIPPSFSVKVILAHWAILATLKDPSFNQSSRYTIESSPLLKDYFDLCIRQLKDLKYFKVHGTVTLFKLLVEKQEKIVTYACNEEITSTFSCLIKNVSQLEPYYKNTLQKKVSEGLSAAKLQRKVALAIEGLTGMCTERYHIIVYRIIRYLNRSDLLNLCRIDQKKPIKVW